MPLIPIVPVLFTDLHWHHGYLIEPGFTADNAFAYRLWSNPYITLHLVARWSKLYLWLTLAHQTKYRLLHVQRYKVQCRPG